MVTRVESLKALKNRIEGLKAKIAIDPNFIGHRAALDWQSKKYSLYIKQRGRCCFCNDRTFADSAHGPKKRIATIEHIQCRAVNGSDNIENLAISCWDCNNQRGTLDFDEFNHLVKTHGAKKAYTLIKGPLQISKKERLRAKKEKKQKEQILSFETDECYRAKVLASIENATDKVKAMMKKHYGITD